MFSVVRDVFRGIHIEEKGEEIIVSGIDARVLVRDINKHWRTTRITINFFNQQTRNRLSFFKFFAPEFVYLLEGITQYRSRYTSIKAINELKEKMYTQTWLEDIQSDDVSGRLNFNRLRNMTYTPEDYQMAYFKDYDIRLNKYSLKGDLVDAGTGTGKALANYSPVKTPKGWKAIGDLKVGDLVTTVDGLTTKVSGVYPQGVLKTFNVTFADGRSVEACMDHQWEVIIDGKAQILTTEDLGIKLYLGDPIYIPLIKSQIHGTDSQGPMNKLYNGSTTARIEILGDYFDKYGITIRDTKKPLIATTELDVARTVQMLVRSLGGISEIISESDSADKVLHQITIELPKTIDLGRGLDNYHLETNQLQMIDISYSGEQHCTCISVEHDSKLFVTKDYIVTHNTYITTAIAEMLESDLIVVVCPKETLELVWLPSIQEMYRKKQTVWASNRLVPYKGERFIVCHYDALDKLQAMLTDVKVYRNKKITTILDESHNMNNIDSMRTQRYLDIVNTLDSDNNLLASGTAVKALGVELIPLLRVVDPMFTKAVEKRFRAMYGHAASKGLDIIKYRLGLVSFKIEKTVLNMEPPIMYQHPIKIPNGNDYTLPSIKLVMEKYIKERIRYYESRKSEDEQYWKSLMRIHRNVLTNKEAIRNYETYISYVELIRRHPGRLSEFKDQIRFCNQYEKSKIEPTLPREHIKRFRETKSIIKYVGLKIQGECLGNVLGRKRIECHIDMVPYVDWVGIIESTVKKTIVFTSFVEALEVADKHLGSIGLKPTSVYGANKSEMVRTVERFDKDKNLNPLIATYMSLSTGVRLTMADTIILLNSPFRQYILEQAIARAYRKGQDSQVNVYKVTLDTGDVPNISTRSDDILKWSAEQVAAILGMESNYTEGETLAQEALKFNMELKDIPDEERLLELFINKMFDDFDIEVSLEHLQGEKTNILPFYLR